MKFINRQRIKSINLYYTYFFLFILLFHFTNLLSQNKVDYYIDNLEIPKLKDNEVVIRHTGFSLSYNEKHEQANWVAYELTGPETVKLYERTNKFLLDPKIESGTANDTDYLYSGYDKGHLAPAGDMGWSETTMSESFYYSNMSPQDPAFNRGIWKKLEDLVRVWAVENNSIYIVTGPILQDSLRTLGMNEVSIPKYFYKVILDYDSSETKAIGFVLPNMGSDQSLQSFAVSIDSIEKITGINFFHLLKDDEEALVESSVCIDCWSWKNSTRNSVQSKGKSTSQPSQTNSGSVQCSGTTQAGNRCKRMTTNVNGRCYQHQ